jgi:AraC-like DNA-binding protein
LPTPEVIATPDGTTVEHVEVEPAPALRPYLRAYCGYRQAGGPAAVHRGLPSPHLTVILTLDDPLVMAAHPDPGQSVGCYDALVGGLHTRRALISHQGRQSGIQLSLSPLGARALLGLPAGALASTDVHAQDVFGRFTVQLLDRVREAPGWAARFAVLDRLLLERLDRAGPCAGPCAGPPAEVTHAWRMLAAGDGRTDVAGLARAGGWSPRHLAQRFGVEVGLTPKQVVRVVRFDRARRALLRQAIAGHPPRLADLAVAHGYYDQPHLDREFRALAGCPPSAWLAEELRNVQVPSPGALASSPS